MTWTKEKATEYARSYKTSYPERFKESRRKCYLKYQEDNILKSRKYRKRNRLRIWLRDNNMNDKLKTLLGNICVCIGAWRCLHDGKCGIDFKPILQKDHIYNDGYEDRKKLSNGMSYKRYYRDHPDEAKRKLQLLCPSCNMAKYLHFKRLSFEGIEG